MTWNLWNVVRHYAYIRYFKNRNRELGEGQSDWQDLENYTKKLMKGIYRSFKEKQYKGINDRTKFTDQQGGGSSTNGTGTS